MKKTPTMAPTFIASKRFLLCTIAVLFSLLYLHISVHKSYVNENQSGAEIWTQPEEVKQDFPERIGESTWQLDYLAIEKLVWNIPLTNSQDIAFNDTTRDTISYLSDFIPRNLDNKELQQLEKNLAKMLPKNTGMTLMLLVKQYQHFQLEYQALLDQVAQAQSSEQMELLQALSDKKLAVQSQIFGSDVAKPLFGQHNRMTDYLSQRRMIRLDTRLTESEKVRRLSELQNAYADTLIDKAQ